MITGMADKDICKEWRSLDEKDLKETIGYVDGKEMARDAMSNPLLRPLFSHTNPLKNHSKIKW